MVEKKIMISIDDERAKYISEVIGNKSCKKIIDYLSENDATVSDISKELKMPINTVDYNVKKLEKSGLIERKSFWWSSRGKKMPTYTVSNKEIIISPGKKKNFMKYFYAFVVTGLASLFLRWYSLKEVMTDKLEMGEVYLGVDSLRAIGEGADESANSVVQKSVEVVSGISEEGVNRGGEFVASTIPPVADKGVEVATSGLFGIEIWGWFLIGAWSMIFIFFLISILGDKKFRR